MRISWLQLFTKVKIVAESNTNSLKVDVDGSVIFSKQTVVNIHKTPVMSTLEGKRNMAKPARRKLWKEYKHAPMVGPAGSKRTGNILFLSPVLVGSEWTVRETP